MVVPYFEILIHFTIIAALTVHFFLIRRKLKVTEERLKKNKCSGCENVPSIVSSLNNSINECFKMHQNEIMENHVELKCYIMHLEAIILRINATASANALELKNANRRPRTDEEKKAASEKRKSWWEKKRQEQKELLDAVSSIPLTDSVHSV